MCSLGRAARAHGAAAARPGHGSPAQDGRLALEAVLALAPRVLGVWLDVCVAARPLLRLLAHNPVPGGALRRRGAGREGRARAAGVA